MTLTESKAHPSFVLGKIFSTYERDSLSRRELASIYSTMENEVPQSIIL